MVIMITLEKVKEVLSPEQYETFLSVILRTYSYVTLCGEDNWSDRK